MGNELVPQNTGRKGLYALSEATAQAEMEALGDQMDPESLHAELALLKYMLQDATRRKDTREMGALVDLIGKTAKLHRIAMMATSEFLSKTTGKAFFREILQVVLDQFQPFFDEDEFTDHVREIELRLEKMWHGEEL